MEYQPFDFEKLDALLRECDELTGSSPPPDPPSDPPRRPHPVDDGFGDPDPFSGWPTLEEDLFQAAPIPQVSPTMQHPAREGAARRRVTEAASHRRHTEDARPSAPRASSTDRKRRKEAPAAEARSSRREAPASSRTPRRGRKSPDPAPVSRRQRNQIPAADESEEEWEEVVTPKRRKKHRILRVLLVLILLLCGTLFAVLKFNLFQPTADTGTLGARKTGASTILIAGTDDGGSRTDTMMLVYVNAVSGELNLISLPRDTLVNAGYNVPKLNACYGVNGGGAEGMEALMDKVQAIIGFRPDGYVLTNLDTFIELVDLMGGVTFDVPQDMYYNDPSQDLYIDLQAGEQTLNGEQAMGLVRYRSGYATADVQRMSVQRDFISAAIDQWASFGNIAKLPQALALVQSSLTTDLSTGNVVWLAGALLRAGTGNLTAETMAGSPTYWNGGSYYALDPAGVAEMVNAYCNPYEQEVTAADLQIRLP